MKFWWLSTATETDQVVVITNDSTTVACYPSSIATPLPSLYLKKILKFLSTHNHSFIFYLLFRNASYLKVALIVAIKKIFSISKKVMPSIRTEKKFVLMLITVHTKSTFGFHSKAKSDIKVFLDRARKQRKVQRQTQKRHWTRREKNKP